MANILLVDDDAALAALVRTALERDGHRVQTRPDTADVDEPLLRWANLVLLDVMMPGEDGISFCARVRAAVDAPILFLTARTDEATLVKGLGVGGDDYIAKPFTVAQLRARVAAHLRREKREKSSVLHSFGLTFDMLGKALLAGEAPLPLTRGEYALCEFLALHAGQVFAKEQIYEAVFGFDAEGDETAVAQHIKNIRAKLRAAGAEPIDTVWGVGYKWKKEERA